MAEQSYSSIRSDSGSLIVIGSGGTDGAVAYQRTFLRGAKLIAVSASLNEAVTGSAAAIKVWRRKIANPAAAFGATGDAQIGAFSIGVTHSETGTTLEAGDVLRVITNAWGDTEIDPGETVAIELDTKSDAAAGDAVFGIEFYEFKIGIETTAVEFDKPSGTGGVFNTAGTEV